MRLYHFTSVGRLAKILADRRLTRTDSKSPGPDVVWLTTDRTPERGHGLSTGGALGPDKMAVRITVELPAEEVCSWAKWAPRHGMDREAMTRLAHADGSDSWYVCEREIPDTEWCAVETVRANSAVQRLMDQPGSPVEIRSSWVDESEEDEARRLARLLDVMSKPGQQSEEAAK
jgi:hypothetical protein